MRVPVETPPRVEEAPDPGTPVRRSRLRPYALAGALGGLAALILGAIALATGLVDGKTTRVVEQRSSQPAVLTTRPGQSLDARAIYAADSPGVAFVRSSGITTNTPFGSTQGVATGSGFVVDRQGDILTNAHVVSGARRVTVRFGGSGSEVPATVAGVDASNDLAVLHVDPSNVALHPLPLGNSARAHVGDPVVAIGNPFGYDRTITGGIVSALQRHITAPDGFTIDHVIQTDAAINPGNSGGPLIDSSGRVIGINSQIATGGSGDANVGIGFAIPIATAKSELPTLERGGTVRHPFLGVETVSGGHGALIRTVEPGSPAAGGGLRRGDVIVSLDSKSIGNADALTAAVAAHDPGDSVSVGYLRNGTHHTVSVKLGTRPNQLTRG
jgi:S1-C subfamily serine protease